MLVLVLLFLVPLVGAVRDFLQDLPADGPAAARIRRALMARRQRCRRERAGGSRERSLSTVPDAISAVLGIAGGFFSVFLVCFTIIFICLFLLSDIVKLKRSLGSVLMPGEDERWLGVWERVTTSISRWAIGRRRDRHDRRHDPRADGLAARVELCARLGG